MERKKKKTEKETNKEIKKQVRTCDYEHSVSLQGATPIGDHASGTIMRYPTQSHYPDTESISPYTFPVMPSARLGHDKYNLGVFVCCCFMP